MKHARALILALTLAVVSACATAGAGPSEGGATGNQPRDTEGTREASVHLVQAGLSEGDNAQALYQEAMTAALVGIDESPTNPKAYLIAGQAAVGLRDWVRADTMFDRALELYPGYQDQILAEREEGWILAYNMGADALEAGDLAGAQEHFEAADALFRGRPEAQLALASVYRQQGDAEAAAEAALTAMDILEDMPEGLDEEQQAQWTQTRRQAALNATDLLGQTGDYARAASVLEDFLEEFGPGLEPQQRNQLRTALAGYYAQSGRADEAEALYDELLGGENLSEFEYFQAGVGFFNTGDYLRAADAFESAADINPYFHGALLNQVQSLYSAALELEESGEGTDDQLRELYEEAVDAAERVRAMDPLNRNLVSFMLRSYRALAELNPGDAASLNERAQELFRAFQSQEYEVSGVQAVAANGQARITGTLTNLQGDAGSTVGLRFELLNSSGNAVGSTTIQVQAPAQGEAVQFEGTANVADFAGWRYSLAQ